MLAAMAPVHRSDGRLSLPKLIGKAIGNKDYVGAECRYVRWANAALIALRRRPKILGKVV